jgi:apolipoprotein N-acyltransferase
VVRSTNAGMTTIIDPDGRILTTLPPFTEGCLSGTVPVHTGPKTLYTRWGDWFPFLLLALGAAGLAAGLVLRLARRRATPGAS